MSNETIDNITKLVNDVPSEETLFKTCHSCKGQLPAQMITGFGLNDIQFELCLQCMITLNDAMTTVVQTTMHAIHHSHQQIQPIPEQLVFGNPFNAR